MPAFGFSVGDIIATIGRHEWRVWCWYPFPDFVPELVRRLASGLSSTSGAAAKYQRTVIELETLQRSLKHAEALAAESDADNADRINQLRAAAFATSLTLQGFNRSLTKYESGLASGSSSHRIGRVARSVQFTMSMDQEVDRLHLYITGQMVSINHILQMIER